VLVRHVMARRVQDAVAQYKQNTGKDVAVTLDSVNFLAASDDPHDPSVATACPRPTPYPPIRNQKASFCDPPRLKHASRAEVANWAVAGAHQLRRGLHAVPCSCPPTAARRGNEDEWVEWGGAGARAA
jgi:hypothetical protein